MAPSGGPAGAASDTFFWLLGLVPLSDWPPLFMLMVSSAGTLASLQEANAHLAIGCDGSPLAQSCKIIFHKHHDFAVPDPVCWSKSGLSGNEAAFRHLLPGDHPKPVPDELQAWV